MMRTGSVKLYRTRGSRPTFQAESLGKIVSDTISTATGSRSCSAGSKTEGASPPGSRQVPHSTTLHHRPRRKRHVLAMCPEQGEYGFEIKKNHSRKSITLLQ